MPTRSRVWGRGNIIRRIGTIIVEIPNPARVPIRLASSVSRDIKIISSYASILLIY